MKLEMSINSGDVGVNSAGKSRMVSRARQRKGNEEQKGSGSTERMDKGSRAERMGVEVVLDQ